MDTELKSMGIISIDGTLPALDSVPEEITLPQQLQWCKAMLHIHGLLTEREKEKVDKRFYKRWHIKDSPPTFCKTKE